MLKFISVVFVSVCYFVSSGVLLSQYSGGGSSGGGGSGSGGSGGAGGSSQPPPNCYTYTNPTGQSCSQNTSIQASSCAACIDKYVGMNSGGFEIWRPSCLSSVATVLTAGQNATFPTPNYTAVTSGGQAYTGNTLKKICADVYSCGGDCSSPTPGGPVSCPRNKVNQWTASFAELLGPCQ
jgi:hypothetical protein